MNGKGKELSYDGTNSFVYYPSVSFGGVIGCVLGGDNIIDNVTVNIDAGWLTISGAKKHLIQVGGYVGSVSGGGVIFRNIPAGTDWILERLRVLLRAMLMPACM